MIHPAWIFAAATTTAGLGIYLLLSSHSSRLRQLGAALAAIGAFMISTQMPRMESLLADSAFMLLSAVLLVAAVATVVSHRPLQSAAYFLVALVAVLALLLFAGIELAVVTAVAALCVLVPGGFLLVFERELLRRLAPRLRLRGRAKLVDGNTDEPLNAELRLSKNIDERASRCDTPVWEPLLCAASGMVLAGVLAMVVHTVYAGSDAMEQPTTAPLQNYMTLAAVLLGVGLSGFLSRQSLVVMLLSAEVMLLGVMLGWTAGYHIPGDVVGQGSLMMVALAAVGQPLVALAALYPASRSLKKPAEAGSLQGGTIRGELLAMVAGLLILIGMLLS